VSCQSQRNLQATGDLGGAEWAVSLLKVLDQQMKDPHDEKLPGRKADLRMVRMKAKGFQMFMSICNLRPKKDDEPAQLKPYEKEGKGRKAPVDSGPLRSGI
jgi:hypothetical protein